MCLFVGRFCGLLAGLLACWLAGWLAGLLAGLLACLLACLLAGLLVGLLACLRYIKKYRNYGFDSHKLYSASEPCSIHQIHRPEVIFAIRITSSPARSLIFMICSSNIVSCLWTSAVLTLMNDKYDPRIGTYTKPHLPNAFLIWNTSCYRVKV